LLNLAVERLSQSTMKEAPKPKNKKSGNGFKFNPYWIYGILFIVFLALNFLPRSAGKSTHWNEVRNMIVQGDVKELKLINDRFLEVYISTEASEKEEYSKDQDASKICLARLSQTTVLKSKKITSTKK
jgi:hypothetical protein